MKMKIAEPINIGNMTLKNRFVVPAMGSGYAAAGIMVSDRLIHYLEARALGGFGLVTVETTIVTDFGFGDMLAVLGMWDDGAIPVYKRLVDRVHAAGAKVAIQLNHPGRAVGLAGSHLVGPSAVADPFFGWPPRELKLHEIKWIVEDYAQAARRCKAAGFDAVEFHGAHGYLIAQFMSGFANKRTDAYGGSFEGFMKFPLEILKRTRELVGQDYPIIFRFSGEEGVPGGRTVKESVEVAKCLCDAGVDAIHISAGVYASNQLICAPTDLEPGFNIKVAAAIKKAISKPLIVVGRINSAGVAEDIVSSGQADMVAIGRESISDPAFANKAIEGRDDEIVRCVACNECFDNIVDGKIVMCVQNSAVGREGDYIAPRAKQPKKILVAGGGPAGLEAARTAAIWGHSVIVYEKKDKLGGQIPVAAVPPHKEILNEIIKSRVQALQQLKVEIKLGTEVTPELVKKLKPDVLIVATGSEPVLPAIPGIDGKNVVSAREVLAGTTVGNNVVVIGGGLVGAETADYLAAQGKQVTIIEVLSEIAYSMSPAARGFLLKRLNSNSKVKIMTSTSVKEIKGKNVSVIRDGVEQTLGPVDNVVVSIGAKSVNGLAALKDSVPQVIVLGDAKVPGKIIEATRRVAMAARKL